MGEGREKELIRELVNKKLETQTRLDKKEKSTIRVLDICIIFVFIFVTIYTGVVLVIFSQIGTEPMALTAGVFGIFSGELLMCMLLQRTKIKLGKKNKENDNDDDDNDDDDDDDDGMDNIVVG